MTHLSLLSRKFVATAMVVVFAALAACQSEPQKTATPYAKDSCCAKAAAEGKACAHPCCVDAVKAGKVCEKCNKL